MSSTDENHPGSCPALVSRHPAYADAAVVNYLVLSDDGQTSWTDNPRAATAFASMREATRMAFRLPAALRAYGMPRSAEMTFSH